MNAKLPDFKTLIHVPTYVCKPCSYSAVVSVGEVTCIKLSCPPAHHWFIDPEDNITFLSAYMLSAAMSTV